MKEYKLDQKYFGKNPHHQQKIVVRPGDHEGSQVGRVDGQEDEGEGGPDVSHEPGRRTPWAVHIDRSLGIVQLLSDCFNNLAA